MAFLNNTRDQDVSDEASFLRFFEEKDQKKLDELTEWLKKNTTPQKAEQYTHYVRTLEPRIYFHLFDQYKNGTLEPTAAAMLQNNGALRLKQAPVKGKRKLLLYYRSRQPATVVRISTDSLNGPLVATTKLDTSRSFQIAYIDLPPFSTRKDLHFSFTNAKVKDQKDDIAALMWVAFWAEDFPGKGKFGYEEQYANFHKLLVTSAETMPIMQENPPEYARVTRVFERGSFLSPAAAVAPDVPKSLHAFPKNAPRNRLGLAQWLTSKQNPLTARVAVNRFWEQLFGTGLVETLEDFGSQGFTPTHVELLDYLSYKFMHEYNWQMKPLLKEIVLSATYRQDSRATDAQIAQDPTNRWLARGPRVRLTGEQIRDQALIVSGLLSNKMYGKPVMPYQPQGVWQVVYSGISWKRSEGEDAYRRAIYTFIRRSSPYPSMLTFDGSNRDVCLARRIRTNTPLQALVTLNDSAFVEMSIKFAERMEKEGGKNVSSKLQRGYWLMTGRPLPPAKQKVLVNLYVEAVRRFEKERAKAVRWIGRETATPNDAALAFVANTMLNMDEFISKQ